MSVCDSGLWNDYLLPKFSSRSAQLIIGAAGHADHRLDQIDQHTITRNFIGSLLLAVVWSTCVGPTLGGPIALASQGKDLIWDSLIMASFALVVVSFILTTRYSDHNLIQPTAARCRYCPDWRRPYSAQCLCLLGLPLILTSTIHSKLGCLMHCLIGQ